MSFRLRLPLLHRPALRESTEKRTEPKVERTATSGGQKPVHRGDCLEGGSNAVRPCHWYSCRYHLPVEAAESCALDVADKGEHSLEEIGALLGVTRERVRQIEAAALLKLQKKATSICD